MKSDHNDFQKIIARLKTSGIQRNFKVYNDDIVNDMEKIFESYTRILAKFLDSNDEINNSSLFSKLFNRLKSVENLGDSIKKSTIKYLEGDIRSSYNEFSTALDAQEIKDALKILTNDLGTWANRQKPAFRLRISSEPLQKREEMFHISFNQRELVKTQRYSVEGLPCLYLGTSLYICWQELGCPDLDKLYISAFCTSDDEKELGILNLAYTLDSLTPNNLNVFFDYNNENEDMQLAYLILWPLVVACSYVKKIKNASFNPEYIIPNLLMQKISSDKELGISGIAYYSTKSERTSSDTFGVNIVLPPQASYKNMTEYMFCPTLVKGMVATNPVSWSLLSTLRFYHENESDKFIYDEDIEDVYDTLLKSYKATDFNVLEGNIRRNFKFSAIENKKISYKK